MNDPAPGERIYLDNAATSWPKPQCVVRAMSEHLTFHTAAAGRGEHTNAALADTVIASARRRLATEIGAAASQIVLTHNGTHALNIALLGFLRPGDHVVTTQTEHNSVLRPLHWLQQHRDITITHVDCDSMGFVDPDLVDRAMLPATRLVVISHASNVTGAVQDLAAIAAITQRHGVALLVDAAQSLGHLTLDVAALNIDMLACSGHKGLLGPLGTGMLYLSEQLAGDVQPIMFGGTGSESHQLQMPTQLPQRHEAGNLNVPAIAGLSAALAWRQDSSDDTGADADTGDDTGDDAGTGDETSAELAWSLADRLSSLSGVRVFRQPGGRFVPVVSIDLPAWNPSDVAAILDAQFGIQTRSGMHCAPLIHKALGTPSGTVRLSPNRFTRLSHIDAAVSAIIQIAESTP